MFIDSRSNLSKEDYYRFLWSKSSNISDGKKMLGLMTFAFILYTPFIFLGYGSDFDSYQVINTGKSLIAEHVYIPSRYPGYPVYEISTAMLDYIGGATLTNFGSLVVSLIVIYTLKGIFEYHMIPHKYVLTLVLITNPTYWVSSTSTMDYVWALALMLIGYRLFLSKRFAWSGVFLGLAIGTRLSSVIFLVALLSSHFLIIRVNRKQLLLCGLVAVFIGSILYVPSLLHSGFLKLYFGDWNWIDYLINFIYGNLQLLGPQTYLAVLCAGYFTVNSTRQFFATQYRWLLLLCILVIAGYEGLFLSIPLEVAYLLPLLPFLLILLGLFLKEHKWVIVLWLILQSSFNFVSIELVNVTGSLHKPEGVMMSLLSLQPSIAGKATSISIGVFYGWGYSITDIFDRVNGTFN